MVLLTQSLGWPDTSQGRAGERSLAQVEVRVEREGIGEVARRLHAVTRRGGDHPGVVVQERVPGPETQRTVCRAHRLCEPPVLVERPGQRVVRVDVAAGGRLLARESKRMGRPP